MRVRIRRLHPAAVLPDYQSTGAAAFDLSASADVDVPPGEVRLVPTGLVVEVPNGHFLAVIARSSLPIKKKLFVANSVGVIDSDYRGPTDEVKIEVYNFSAQMVRVSAGERIAQGLVLAAPRVEWDEVHESTAPSRGGFGGTAGYER
jgi:dUTP pyrophosphatase